MGDFEFDDTTLILALLAFVSTTVDDFAVVLIFFARVLEEGKKNCKSDAEIWNDILKVVGGQTMAFTIIVLISLIGMILGLFVPTEYIDLIGQL